MESEKKRVTRKETVIILAVYIVFVIAFPCVFIMIAVAAVAIGALTHACGKRKEAEEGKCPRCWHMQNPRGKFCGECGARMK